MPNRNTLSMDLIKKISLEEKELIDLILKDLAVQGLFEEDQSKTSLRSKKELCRKQLASIGTGEYRKRLAAANKLLHYDLKAHLTTIELAEVECEFEQGLNNIINLSEERASSCRELYQKMEAMPDSMQGMIGLSNQTIEHCYRCGMRHYESHHYQEAADIFFFLIVLSPYRFNVWIAQGLAEKQIGNYENALRSYAMASIVNPNSVLPFIHSIDCYLYINDPLTAKKSLELALKTLHNHPTKENLQFEAHIKSKAITNL